MSTYDIIIIGSGIVGAATALALAKTTSLKIAILDSQNVSSDWQSQHYDHRVSAISLASKQFFQAINIFENISAKRISSYTHMHVWEELSQSKIEFDCSDIHEDALGYIVEDSVMRTSLYDALNSQSNIDFLHPVQLVSLQENAESVDLVSQDHRVFSAKLVIAADGANSWVREQARIELKTWDYHHSALVATVKTEKPHQKTAWQRFLTTGPLAFLPFSDDHTSSIVWSTLPAHAEKLLALDDQAFQEELSEAFAYQLGEVTFVSERYAFPLRMRHAKKYVKSRIALVGDAAHTIHPLAGQGVNLGLLDAATLVQVISDAVNKRRDFASFATLRRYERWRKGDNLAMLAMVEALKHLFMSDKKSLQALRQMGLSVTSQIPLLKNFFVSHAVGKRGDLPEIIALDK